MALKKFREKKKRCRAVQVPCDVATKQDLNDMEKRLSKAIAKKATITPSVEAAAMRLQSELDKLDATIPDKE